MTQEYSAPLDVLLTMGRPLSENRPDYSSLGIGPDHIPALIKLAGDDELRWRDTDDPALWAPIHAWYALGQLRAEQAVGALLGELRYIDEDWDDVTGEEMPEVLGQIGPAGIPEITKYALSRSNGLWARVAAGEALKEVGIRHPDARSEVIASLQSILEQEGGHNAELLGFVAYSLAQLKAVEVAPLLEQAFGKDWVDDSVAGDWEDLQIIMGLRAVRTKPKVRNNPFEGMIGSAPKKRRVRRRRRKA